MNLARHITLGPVRPGRHSFRIKAACALALIALADLLFFGQMAIGWPLGIFVLAAILAVLVAQPLAMASRGSRLALAVSVLIALALIDNPGLLAIALGWTALALAVLLPRAGGLGHAGAWIARLVAHPVASAFRFLGDGLALARLWRRHPIALMRLVPLLALPVLGTLLFLILFSNANPVIGEALAGIRLDRLFAGLSSARATFWLFIGGLAWALLRPGPLLRLPVLAGTGPVPAIPGVSIASVTLSLFAFNTLFALQNALDVIYLWSGAPLPGDLTLATYAHQGAYPLIVTALLAGLFVLITFRPGSAMAANMRLRRLVYLWIGQNVVLVGFSVERTADYIEAFSLTTLRLAALIWMALVAVGLVLLCWRIFRRRSTTWLINANAVAAGFVLLACTAIDLGAVTAAYNVRHNAEIDGDGPALDLCYLELLGPAALLPLIELEHRDLSAEARARVAGVRGAMMQRLNTDQADWHRWTFRNARRLKAAEEVARDLPTAPEDADCWLRPDGL